MIRVNQEDILKLIRHERQFQDQKWGEQNHDDLRWLAILSEEIGEVAKAIIEGNHRAALKEIVQVATVTVAWLEAIGRRNL